MCVPCTCVTGCCVSCSLIRTVCLCVFCLSDFFGKKRGHSPKRKISGATDFLRSTFAYRELEAKEEADFDDSETLPLLALSRYDNVDVRNGNLCCPNRLACIASTIFPCVWLQSFVTVQENTGLVVLTNGKLSAAITEPGLHAGACVCAGYRSTISVCVCVCVCVVYNLFIIILH